MSVTEKRDPRDLRGLLSLSLSTAWTFVGGSILGGIALHLAQQGTLQIPVILGGLVCVFVVSSFVYASLLKQYWDRRHPFELDPDKILYYKGRRNVAFGVQTINRTFDAFAQERPASSKRDDCLHAVGVTAGAAFAEHFNEHISYVWRRKQERQKMWEAVLEEWENYDDNAGFGDINKEGVHCDAEGVSGIVRINNLFTEGPNGDYEPLCSWMAGYLEGFFSNATVLKGEGTKRITVTHRPCVKPIGKGKPYCEFEITR